MSLPEEKGLETIEKIRAGIRFELKHGYINLVGKQGDFATFVKKETKAVLSIFKRSDNWNKILLN